MPRMTFMMVILLLLPACAQQSDERQSVGQGSSMLRLQLLLTQAASLSALPGDSARQHALELARRAMSGSEMNAMHHGGGANKPMMKATHDLGDAVFELLDVSPQQSVNNTMQQQSILLHVQLAVQAAQMRLTGRLLGENIGTFMQQQGQSLQASFSDGDSDVDKAAFHLFTLLDHLARTHMEHGH